MGKKTSIRKSIRINGALHQARFTSNEDAAEWYAKELRRKKRVENGLEESLEPNLMTTLEYSKIFMRRRVANELVVKGTWVNDGQRLEDYINPLLGDDVFQSIKPQRWTEALDMIQRDPLKVLEVALRRARGEEERETFREKIARGRKPLSNATRNKIRTLINTMYEEAIKVDKIAFINQIAQVDVKDEGDPEEKSDYWETIKEIQSYLRAHREYADERGFYAYHLMAVMALNRGPRAGEMIALLHKDFDLIHSRVRLSKTFDQYTGETVQRTKGSRRSSRGRTRSSRWLYLNEPIIEAYQLHASHTANKEAGAPIFVNAREVKFAGIKNQGLQMTVSGFAWAHDKMCERAGVKRIRLHDLRHTFASHFLMNGGSIEVLAEILGHSSTYVTQRYGHLAASHVEKEAKRVDFSLEQNDAKRDATVMPLVKKTNGLERGSK